MYSFGRQNITCQLPNITQQNKYCPLTSAIVKYSNPDNLLLVCCHWCLWLMLWELCQQWQLLFLSTDDLVQFGYQSLQPLVDPVLTVKDHLQLPHFRLLKLTTSTHHTTNSLYHLSLRCNGHFSRWTWVNDFYCSENDGGCGDNWSCKMCKAPVKSSLPTNQHPLFYGRMPFLSWSAIKKLSALFPVTQPTASKHWREPTLILYICGN